MTPLADLAAWIAKHGKEPVRYQMLDGVIRMLIDALKDRTTRIEVLEQRLAVLETKSATAGCRWAGIYHEGQVYEEGSLVTHSGSLWLARRTTDEKPGASRDFVLIVKRGEANIA